jgi:hypothetical protein
MADVDHNNLTGAAAVHPASYTQTSDPGAVGANKLWVDTTLASRVLKQRNSANTTWVTVQNPLTAAGGMIYGGTSGTQTQLTIGTSGYILTSNGTAPAWAKDPGVVARRIVLASVTA